MTALAPAAGHVGAHRRRRRGAPSRVSQSARDIARRSRPHGETARFVASTLHAALLLGVLLAVPPLMVVSGW
ncbi:hypothetical protein ACL02T_33130 [Pseudonocardia sp. RS010]|uniref:hypothetical protein n=1 Tax=Pseudonocardia sp. RS010 TaxID=3385979 RepID=UPI0039A1753A